MTGFLGGEIGGGREMRGFSAAAAKAPPLVENDKHFAGVAPSSKDAVTSSAGTQLRVVWSGSAAAKEVKSWVPRM